jgi:putative endonuclease
MASHKAQAGQAAEELARRFLESHGLKYLKRNVRFPVGEIDLMMEDMRHLVFVEVRYRRQNNFGSGAETVNRTKQAKCVRAALYYLQRHPQDAHRPMRFDVVSIEGDLQSGSANIDWIKNAFTAQE